MTNWKPIIELLEGMRTERTKGLILDRKNTDLLFEVMWSMNDTIVRQNLIVNELDAFLSKNLPKVNET